MSITKTIQQMVDALASIANEPDRTLQQRPVRFAKAKEAIQAGRVLLESIAKQEQGEPVACANGCSKFFRHPQPQQRKPLTEEQIWGSNEIMAANGTTAQLPMIELVAVVRAVEAAHGIKE